MSAQHELVVRKVGEHFEIISNGTFLMDTRNGESERLLVRAALDRVSEPRDVLIGGLGVGFSVAEALKDQRLDKVVVVEIEPDIVRWNHEDLSEVNGGAIDEPRVRVLNADLLRHLAATQATYSAICLDIDNGPDWTITPENAALYGDEGTALVAKRLRPGGVLTVWSASGSAEYEATLGRHFATVETIEVPVSRGQPDVVFVATGQLRMP